MGGVPVTASAANMPSSSAPLMSEMIAGGAFQAINGRRRKLEGESKLVLHVVEQRLLVFLALDVGLVGSAQVLACAGEGERLLAVDVVGSQCSGAA